MKNLIYGLYAQTPIHAGFGQNLGVIDNPIQRESHNDWPCIYGSSMKGALRYHVEQKETPQNTNILFGKASTHEGMAAGALLISDARLLLLPVRSLTTQFRYVTCPAVLKRLAQDIKRIGQQIDKAFLSKVNDVIKVLTDQSVVVHAEDKKSDNALYLEEFRFNTNNLDLTEIIDVLSTFMAREDAKNILLNQLTIIDDDNFGYFCTQATPVNTHIALDSETKTTKSGALFYEETLPTESLLYLCIMCQENRLQGLELSLDPYLQVGGNETVGMGWFALKLRDEDQAS